MRLNPDPRGPVWLWAKTEPAGDKPKRRAKEDRPRPKPALPERKPKNEAGK